MIAWRIDSMPNESEGIGAARLVYPIKTLSWISAIRFRLILFGIRWVSGQLPLPKIGWLADPAEDRCGKKRVRPSIKRAFHRGSLVQNVRVNHRRPHGFESFELKPI